MTSDQMDSRPLVSVVLPLFNEAPIVEANLDRVCKTLASIEREFRWEIIVVNDGSIDGTGELADAFAASHPNVSVLHHSRNFGLGQALRYGFSHTKGDYVATLDVDLSYSPQHLVELVRQIQSSGAKIVGASPYMKGGRLSAVPWFRRIPSIWANRFLALAARGNLSTLTGMVRVYDGLFLRSVSLRAMGMEINPELIYKGMLLGARIEEIPGHLDWSEQASGETERRSSFKIFRQMISVLLSGFLFRPVMFFILPGLALILIALYPTTWMFIHFFTYFFGDFGNLSWLPSRASQSVAAAFELAPHTFFVAGISWMLGIQLVSLGILALQSKSYFEEIFHLGSSLLRTEKGRR